MPTNPLPDAVAAHLRQRAKAEAERARALGVLQTEAEDGYTILEGQRPGLRAARRSIAFAAAAEAIETEIGASGHER